MPEIAKKLSTLTIWNFYFSINSAWKISAKNISIRVPLETGSKLNAHKTFRRGPGHLLNVLCTFNLRRVLKGVSFDSPNPPETQFLNLNLANSVNLFIEIDSKVKKIFFKWDFFFFFPGAIQIPQSGRSSNRNLSNFTNIPCDSLLTWMLSWKNVNS